MEVITEGYCQGCEKAGGADVFRREKSSSKDRFEDLYDTKYTKTVISTSE